MKAVGRLTKLFRAMKLPLKDTIKVSSRGIRGMALAVLFGRMGKLMMANGKMDSGMALGSGNLLTKTAISVNGVKVK